MKKNITIKLCIYIPCIIFGLIFGTSDYSFSPFAGTTLPFLWAFFVMAIGKEENYFGSIVALPLSVWFLLRLSENGAFYGFALGLASVFSAILFSKAMAGKKPKALSRRLAFLSLLAFNLAMLFGNNFFVMGLLLFIMGLSILVFFKRKKHEAS